MATNGKTGYDWNAGAPALDLQVRLASSRSVVLKADGIAPFGAIMMGKDRGAEKTGGDRGDKILHH